MDELIKITFQNGKQAISARELHFFLESKQDFTNWIKGRIEKYDLINGIDFIFETWDIHLNKIIEPINQLVNGSYRTEYIVDGMKSVGLRCSNLSRYHNVCNGLKRSNNTDAQLFYTMCCVHVASSTVQSKYERFFI